MRHFDVVVLGTGPGGEGAAMMLAKTGRDVAVVEKYRDVGGGCTHWATIPSKALRHSVQRMAELRADPLFHRVVGPVELSYPDLLERAGTVIASQSNMRRGFYERNRTTLLHGHGSLVDPHTIEVVGARGSGERYSFDQVVIATGSSPYHPPDVDFSHPRVHDSDSVLSLTGTPRSVVIYGAGVIGCEYASIFVSLGLKVDLVNTRDQLLAFLDDEITDALGCHLRNLGANTLRYFAETTFNYPTMADAYRVAALNGLNRIF